MSAYRARVCVVAVGAVAVLAGCSSSGGGVSTSTLESKLKAEPQFHTLISEGGTKAKITSQLVDCIAKALVKDANPSDLKKYVNGKLNLNDVGAKAKGSSDNAQSEAKACAQSAIQKDKSSAPSS